MATLYTDEPPKYSNAVEKAIYDAASKYLGEQRARRVTVEAYSALKQMGALNDDPPEEPPAAVIARG